MAYRDQARGRPNARISELDATAPFDSMALYKPPTHLNPLRPPIFKVLLSFETQRIRSLCESGSAAAKAFGAESALALRNRLADLRAAESLDELVACDVQVSSDYPDHLEIDTGSGLRLIFKAFSDELQEVSLDESRSAVRIRLVAIAGDRNV